MFDDSDETELRLPQYRHISFSTFWDILVAFATKAFIRPKIILGRMTQQFYLHNNSNYRQKRYSKKFYKFDWKKITQRHSLKIKKKKKNGYKMILDLIISAITQLNSLYCLKLKSTIERPVIKQLLFSGFQMYCLEAQ